MVNEIFIKFLHHRMLTFLQCPAMLVKKTLVTIPGAFLGGIGSSVTLSGGPLLD